MKQFAFIIASVLASITVLAQLPPSFTDSIALVKTTAAIRDAFARRDVAAVVALHHPSIKKYFGGNNVVNGREELQKGLTSMFAGTHLEFIENKIESTVFNGNTAIETSIFMFKSTPLNGKSPSFARGRSMVVYVRDSSSPTGWLSLREMAQAAPEASSNR